MISLSQIFKTDAQCLEEEVSSTQEESTLFQRPLLHTGRRQSFTTTLARVQNLSLILFFRVKPL